MAGFSPRNLKCMRALAEAYPDEQFVQQAVAQIPWGHSVRILDYVKSPAERKWYITQTVANGWSRNILVHQIESDLYKRQGKALTNFPTTLPPLQSDLGQQIVKDPYNFDFLTLTAQAREREVEGGLIEHIRDFLLELGVGFAMTQLARDAFKAQVELASESEYLFPSPSPRAKKPYVTSLRKIWEKTLRRAGIAYFPLYHLRHTFATRLSAGGVADHFVTQMLRQGDASVFKRYSQAKLAMMREALAKLDRHANEHEGIFEMVRPN